MLQSVSDRFRRTHALAGSVLKDKFPGLRHIRIEHYRILYEAHDERLVIRVVRVSHRRQAYRPAPSFRG